tara:strand:- start:355 stop:1206 length:852 start_codon:yes stop_codon:yes gene_type:complete
MNARIWAFAAVVFLMMPALAFAAEVTLTVSAPSTVSGSFTASVDISQVSDYDTTEFVVNYDSSVISLSSIGAGDLTQDANVYYNPSTQLLTINVPGINGVSGSGSIAELNFAVVGTGSSQISISNVVVGDRFASQITVSSIVPATITVGEGAEIEEDAETPTELVQIEEGEVVESGIVIEAEEEGEVVESDIVIEDEEEVPDSGVSDSVSYEGDTVKQSISKTSIIVSVVVVVLLLSAAGAVFWLLKREGEAKTPASQPLPKTPPTQSQQTQNKYYVPEDEEQ